ncbi:MAG: CBS domain-containing protein, partial [Pseudomonadota bacterium]
HLVVAVMLTSAVASTTMQFTSSKSFFRWQLERRGINLNRGRNQSLLLSTSVESLVSASFSRVAVDTTLREARSRMVGDRVAIAVATDDSGYAGCVPINRLLSSELDDNPESPLQPFLSGRDFFVTGETSLNGALELLDQHQLDCVPVVQEIKSGRIEVRGVLYRSDVLRAYNDALRKARDEEYGVT